MTSFYFRLIFGNVNLVQTTSGSEMFEQLLHVTSEDVVIAISFPRYSTRTLKAIDYAKNRGATVIGITDSASSPIAQSSDMSLIAKSDMVSFADSLVAPLSVINALVVAISMKKKTEVVESLENLEAIWDEYKVYEKFSLER